MEIEKTKGVKARTVLWCLTFSGFAMNSMIRSSINIAIVKMISDEFKTTQGGVSECVMTENATFDVQTFTMFVSQNESSKDLNEKNFVSFEKRFLNYAGIEYENNFKWDASKQNQVLGASSILFWLSTIPGGILAKKYGTKIIFGWSFFLASFSCFLLPIATYLSFKALIFVLIIQGFVSGASFPAISHLIGQWIPPNERSKFTSSYMGASIGFAVAYPIFGFIIQTSSWENVFHFCGIFGTIWYCSWLYFVYDLPENHPRIDPSEKEYILNSLEDSRSKTSGLSMDVPWKAILTSRPVWMNIIAQYGSLWAFSTVMAQAPSYFRLVHGLDLETTGTIAGIPYYFRAIFSYFAAVLFDQMLPKFSLTNVRKMATFISLVMNGCFMLALAFSGCNLAFATIFYTFVLVLNGAITSGSLASLVDIGPNFASITAGITMTFTSTSGFISPYVVGVLTEGRQNSVEPWKYVFLISAAIQIFCGLLYTFFGDSTLQKWNKSESEQEILQDEAEKEVLNRSTI